MDKSNLPAHVGIIMDGNGRWALQRGLIRTQGHVEGLNTAKVIVKAAADMGISFLTLYVFSTENWKRSVEEVGFVMGLAKQYLRSELGIARENRIRVRHAGDMEGLPKDIQKELEYVCEETKSFTGMQAVMALNYGGRDEIVRAIKRMIQKGLLDPQSRDFSGISEDSISQNMDNPDIPPPDLIIRTAGEFRTSNFLLWEGAYAEYYISDKLWPDWTGEDLIEAVNVYQNRERRFGREKR